MKDARGHGSNPGRGTGSGIFGRNGVSMANDARFSRDVKPWRPQSDTDITVQRLRDRLRTTESPGHARVILQGIKNLFGG